MNNIKRISIFSVAALAVLCVAVICSVPAAAQSRPQPQVISNAVVQQPVHFDVSPPLRDIALQAPTRPGGNQADAPLRPKLQQMMPAGESRPATTHPSI